jgi:hypothetical protein
MKWMFHIYQALEGGGDEPGLNIFRVFDALNPGRGGFQTRPYGSIS